VFRIPRFIWREVKEAGRLEINMEEYNIREFVEVEQCLNCWDYGHKSARYVREVRCRRCAGFHFHRECIERKVRCVNCVNAGYPAKTTGHDARSQRCPVFLRQGGLHIRIYSLNI
jgi:hypothetical protein